MGKVGNVSRLRMNKLARFADINYHRPSYIALDAFYDAMIIPEIKIVHKNWDIYKSHHALVSLIFFAQNVFVILYRSMTEVTYYVKYIILL